jgi:GNAT superfamily N-acetyltransferase
MAAAHDADLVREAIPEETRLLYPIMRQLRPQLREDAFIARIEHLRVSGYRLAALWDPEVKAVAGFRMQESLAWGRFLYVDDLVTDEAVRGRGYGSRLMTWLVAVAREAGCEQLHLDSGVQRFDAHRFYLTFGMRISSHHFAMELT